MCVCVCVCVRVCVCVQAEWKRIADVCAERGAVVVFDTAYQGYARCAGTARCKGFTPHGVRGLHRTA